MEKLLYVLSNYVIYIVKDCPAKLGATLQIIKRHSRLAMNVKCG